MSPRKWTVAEDEFLRRTDLTVSDIATSLNRTRKAVSIRRSRLGISVSFTQRTHCPKGHVYVVGKRRCNQCHRKGAYCGICAGGGVHDFKHGINGYRYHRCRCQVCNLAYQSSLVRAASAKQKSRARCKAKLKDGTAEFKHGTSGYSNYGCRCDVCKLAASDYNSRPESVAYRRQYQKRNREQIAERRREYRQKNHDQLRDANRCWRERNTEYIKEKSHQYYCENREQVRRSSRRRYWRDHEKILQRQRKSRDPIKAANSNRAWRERNAEHVADRRRQYAAENAERIAERKWLGRQRHGVYYRARDERRRLRYKAIIPAPRGYDAWTPIEDNVALRDDLTIAEICFMLGRSYASVTGRRHNLRGPNDTPPSGND